MLFKLVACRLELTQIMYKFFAFYIDVVGHDSVSKSCWRGTRAVSWTPETDTVTSTHGFHLFFSIFQNAVCHN
jgi:hypothetical protein